MLTGLRNKQDYGQKHNYDVFIDFEAKDEQGLMWHKFNMVERLVNDPDKDYDWIWWLDFDVLITNHTVALADIITDNLVNATNPDEIDFMLTPDCMELNAGSMLFRARPSTLRLLSRVRAYGRRYPDISEQDCLRDIALGHSSQASEIARAQNNVVASHDVDDDDVEQPLETPHRQDKSVLFLKQNTMNAFPEEITCYEKGGGPWRKGMFAVHFAGAWAYVGGDDPYGTLFRKYEGEVVG
ncbi:hypothetical protein LTS18_009429 [Coniosporium uncinatum]|uniref:Uncharacterized protein n=1 Tax=Coniosporium uncinatum TaxID=93489 RepID=A0ACC3DX90_9PEZI|nr:hypothetical protein LTS18_009429 [Coniosporium uncinatum]